MPFPILWFDAQTHEREVRSLAAASVEFPRATPLLLTLDSLPPKHPIPKGIRWQSAVEWLLGK